jgi:hypothetical protein
MGSTVSISRRVSAFRTAAGIFYALFETTYQRGEEAPTPKSSCVAFGTIRQVMAWIFSAMASCESGALQSVSGRIDPLDYMRFWQHALRRPDRQFTHPVWIKASRSRTATIPTRSDIWYDGNRLPFAARLMREHGYPDQALRVERGEEVLMELHRDAALLAALYGGEGGTRIEPWRIIQPTDVVGEGDPSLAPAQNQRQLHGPTIKVYRLDHDLRFCALVSGFRSLSGSPDELMVDFIGQIAPRLEERGDGAGVRAIQCFRQALSAEPQDAPDSLELTIDRDALQSMVFHRSRYALIEHGLGGLGSERAAGMVVSVRDLRATKLLLPVTELPSICLDFHRAKSQSGQGNDGIVAHPEYLPAETASGNRAVLSM